MDVLSEHVCQGHLYELCCVTMLVCFVSPSPEKHSHRGPNLMPTYVCEMKFSYCKEPKLR